MNSNTKQILISLFENWSGEEARSFIPLPASGSYREYVRINGRNKSALGVYNPDKKENTAFIEFSKALKSKNLAVPLVFGIDESNDCYLCEDLGDITLFSLIQGMRKDKAFPQELIQLYKKTIDQLVKIQVDGAKVVPFDKCYPRQAFDNQSMLWDLHYFKYYFLKLARISFDEQLLEDDFNTLINFLMQTETNYFLYRDFQSRNIMIVNDEPWFIDYQGGRLGALQYDLASLLYDAKADIPQSIRNELLAYYISKLKTKITVDEAEFREHFNGYVLIRILQAMGAYGFRGFYEKKEHFLQSIPHAINNLSYLLKNHPLPIHTPALNEALQGIIESEVLKNIATPQSVLEVSIHSFSYKRGVPIDISGHGGGFVFDCRAITNPGKYPEYQTNTGRDKEVEDFFAGHAEMDQFLDLTKALVKQSVDKYLSRGFKHLTINFGCTGGQHRSVFCAEKMSQYLKSNYPIQVNLKHVELEMKKMI